MTNKLYAPILKWKTGERNALQNLYPNQKNKIIPILEITDQIDPFTVYKDLNTSFEDPVYIDTAYVDEGDRGYLISLFEKLKAGGRADYPVILIDDFPEMADKIIELANRLVIKVSAPEDLDGPSYEEIFTTISKWSKDKDIVVDILLDLEVISNKRDAKLQLREAKEIILNHLLNKLFDKIILAVTSFPENLSSLSAGEEGYYDRLDIKLFKNIVQDPRFEKIKDSLIYSDYGVTKFTETDLDFSKLRHGILPKVRYTTNDYYWVLKGQKDRRLNKWIKNYRTLAEVIQKSQYYFGENFSFGDLEIKQRASGEKGPGNNTNWVTIGANRHIAVVVEQLSKIYGI